jgi:hypothetical protein
MVDYFLKQGVTGHTPVTSFPAPPPQVTLEAALPGALWQVNRGSN